MAKREQIGDVWKFETKEQEAAIDDLYFIIQEAFKFKGSWARAYLKKLWPRESWESIKRKLMTEGSVWYVWWMDGANRHLYNLKTGRI